ncbi:MAG: phosphatidate cytidylyltransferase [Proteobacteria bacterium]|nr:phosphatidate cytidylyltransferase [Pseudomonadota bacterium]
MTKKAAAGKIDSSLKIRTRSALVFGAGFLAILYLGGIVFAVIMLAVAALAVYEWSRMVLSRRRHRIILTALGIFYIGFSVGTIVWLRTVVEHGLYHTLTLLLIVWSSDICAYFSGRAIGGPKLAPTVSPKKTWAGFIGSSVGAAVVAASLTCPWVLANSGGATIGHLSWAGYGIMGFVLAMFGQVGDLLISALKRTYGVKDTGALMPGHGGILDRIDALLLATLLFGALVAVFQ